MCVDVNNGSDNGHGQQLEGMTMKPIVTNCGGGDDDDDYCNGNHDSNKTATTTMRVMMLGNDNLKDVGSSRVMVTTCKLLLFTL